MICDEGGMLRAGTLVAAIASLVAAPAPPVSAQGRCERCDLPPGCRGNGKPHGKKPDCTQIELTIESDIDFGRLVMVGDGVGRVMLDLQTGQKIAVGGLEDLGGFPIRGHATVRGAPLTAVRVVMPGAITMNDPAGGIAELRDFETDLPPLPILDANGEMDFSFAGTLYTDSRIAIGGTLRGRVPISVSYD
jgi:hypothetical protein